MLKRIYITLSISIVVTSFTIAKPQINPPEKALARVLYSFIHIQDTLNPDKPHTEELALLIGATNSQYLSNETYKMSQSISKQIKDPAFNGALVITSNPYTTNDNLFYDHQNGTLKNIQTHMGTKYQIEDQKINIPWELHQDTKEISGYTCQLATGTYAGRNYSVWFTTEIPFQGGPWKLVGLPGLVLQAEDSKKEVQFLFAGFETLESEEVLIEFPINVVKTDLKSLEKTKAAIQKNPSAALNARNSGASNGGAVAMGGSRSGGISVNGSSVFTTTRASASSNPMDQIDMSKIKSVSVNKNSDKYSKEVNNPLELESVFKK